MAEQGGQNAGVLADDATDIDNEAFMENIRRLQEEGFGKEENEYVPAGPEDLLPDEYDTIYIETGTYDEQGRAKRLTITMRDPQDPSLAGDFLASRENEDAFADLCRLLIVEPAWLLEPKPVPAPGHPGLYVNANGADSPPVRDAEDAKKLPAVMLARSIIQVNVRHAMMRLCGVGGPFFQDYQNDVRRRMSALVRSAMQSQQNTESGRPNDSIETESPPESDQTESTQTSSPPTSTSKLETPDDSTKSSRSSERSPGSTSNPTAPLPMRLGKPAVATSSADASTKKPTVRRPLAR